MRPPAGRDEQRDQIKKLICKAREHARGETHDYGKRRPLRDRRRMQALGAIFRRVDRIIDTPVTS